MFSDRRDDGSDVSEDLRALDGAESARNLHAQLHQAQVPFRLIVGEENCEVRNEPQDVIWVVVQAEQKIVAWPFGFLASRARESSQWVLLLMVGEALVEDRLVFGEDAVMSRLGELGLASPLSRPLELIGAVEQHVHRARPRLLFNIFDSLELV
jgi:hypothetical protein